MEIVNFTKIKFCHIEVLLKFEEENVEEESVNQVAHFKCFCKEWSVSDFCYECLMQFYMKIKTLLQWYVEGVLLQPYMFWNRSQKK